VYRPPHDTSECHYPPGDSQFLLTHPGHSPSSSDYLLLETGTTDHHNYDYTFDDFINDALPEDNSEPTSSSASLAIDAITTIDPLLSNITSTAPAPNLLNPSDFLDLGAGFDELAASVMPTHTDFTSNHDMLNPSSIDYLLNAQSSIYNEPASLNLSTHSSTSPDLVYKSLSNHNTDSSLSPPAFKHSPDHSPPRQKHGTQDAIPSRVELLEKRRRNNIAARKYRQKRLDRIDELEKALADMTKQRDEFKEKAMRQDAEMSVLRKIIGSGRKFS